MNYLENSGNAVVRRSVALDKLDSAKVYLIAAHPNFRKPLDKVVAATTFAAKVLLDAEQARGLALSHRHFDVGAAALITYSEGPVRSHQFLHGANMKPVKGSDVINIHAEHTVFSKVANNTTEREVAHIDVLGIVGDIQPDQQSGVATRTLQPCGVCRRQFASDDCPVDETTLIVTANPDLTVIEWFDIKGLQAYHETGDDSGIGFVELDHRLPFLIDNERYLKAIKSGLIDLALDTPEGRANEEEFDQLIFSPMYSYMISRLAPSAEAV